jgi:hypothetical protein
MGLHFGFRRLPVIVIIGLPPASLISAVAPRGARLEINATGHQLDRPPAASLYLGETFRYQEAEMLKTATIILLVLLIIAGAFSVLDFVAPWNTLEGDFRAVAGESYKAVKEPGAISVSVLYLRHLCVLSLTTTVASLFILLGGFRHGQRWAWWALLVTGILGWGFGTIINLVIGNMFDFATHLAGLVWILVGLLLPVKTFFARKA